MTVEPQEIRSEPHREIGSCLVRGIPVVLDRWSQRAVAEQPKAKRVHHEVLLDHLRDLLEGLGRSLTESDEGKASQHQPAAAIHGEQRWQAGWSLSEVIRDYQILRIVVVDYLEDVLNRPISCREVLAIGLALDEAIAASVVTYVKGRDDYLRQLEQERAAADAQVQQRLRELAEMLQEADRRKNEFLAILGHELRNPLAPVKNSLELMRRASSNAELIEEARSTMERQIGQMVRLIDDLLDVSRITRNKLELKTELVELASVVQHAVEGCRPHLERAGHELNVNLPAEPTFLRADPVRLTQVFGNLLTNSCKYTEPGGHIWLTAERQGSELVVSVKDTGIGIPPDMLPNVFELFTQVDRPLERSSGGLGIGLSLVKRLVEMHGGTVTAHSDGHGRGCEFIMRLPVLTEKPGARVSPESTGEPTSTMARRILIVDDNRDNADTLAKLLTLTGNDTECAHDGVEAIEKAVAFRPDVILLDIGLPKRNGYEVCREIREQPWGKDIVVVAVTGRGQEEDRRKSNAAGFNGHMTKPVDYAALMKLLATFSRSVRG